MDDEHRALTSLAVTGAGKSSFSVSYEGSRTLSGRDLVDELLADPRAREAVRSLFAAGFVNVERDRRGARALQMGRGEVPPLTKLQTLVGQLALVRDAV